MTRNKLFSIFNSDMFLPQFLVYIFTLKKYWDLDFNPCLKTFIYVTSSIFKKKIVKGMDSPYIYL